MVALTVILIIACVSIFKSDKNVYDKIEIGIIYGFLYVLVLLAIEKIYMGVAV